tara:strand:+ start:3382 stop:4545 length:1164 start_codon:yes stop_codon:yes gene_type:complete
MTSLLNQPTGLFADPREAWLANLLDPRVGHRSAILPLVEVGGDDTGRGSVEFGAPQFLVDMLKSAMLPGAAAQGYQPAPEEVTQMAMDTMLGGGLLGRAPSGVLGMNLWHGGPHRWAPEPDFPHGRPRLDKIGTGEGNQAYGHGFYSAETPGVAGGYKRNLSYKDTKQKFRDDLPDDADFDEVMDLVGTGHFTPYQDNVLRALEGDDWLGFDYPSQAISAAYSRQLSDYDPSPKLVSAIEGGGSLYKLDIPDADVAKYLDWDAPLSEQPKHIQTGFKRAFASTLQGDDADSALLRELYGEDGRHFDIASMGLFLRSKGAQAYNELSARLGGDEAASEALRKAGIPGLKYFDGSSRGKGEGTRNYVTWDQEVLDRSKILERDGEALND